MESGLRTLDTPGEAGGLIVMVRPDPAEVARAIAHDLRAELAIGGAETEQALERRTARELEHRDLDGLAHAMRRAELVRDRTRQLVASKLSKSLNSKVAIHPDTLRRAAIEVLATEAALDAAIRAEVRRRRRWRRVRLGGLAATGAGLAMAAAILPAVGAVIAGTGLVGATAGWWVLGRLPRDPHASLRAHGVLARERWHQVAGVGADARDVEAVIHRYDPQDPVIADLVGHHPAVRAADRVAVARRMAWVTAWRREVGDASPVTDPAIAELLQRDRTELWLTSGTALAYDQPDTLVVAAPYTDLSAPRARALHHRLLGLRTQRVIVVLAPDPEADESAGFS